MESQVVWIVSPDNKIKQLICLNLDRRHYDAIEIQVENLQERSSPFPRVVIIEDGAPTAPALESAQQLRKNVLMHSVPIILLTNRAPATSQLNPLSPIWWLEKPFSMDRLVTLVRTALE